MSTPASTTAAEAAPPPLVPVEGDDDPFSAYGPIVRSLFKSGHPKWGFLVYRVDYGDDEAWQRFMNILNRVTHNNLRNSYKDRLLPYLFWTAVEDRAIYEGASKDAIRGHFRDWVNTRSVERDGPGADNPEIADASPRYRACLYVDKDVLESVSVNEHPYPLHPDGVLVRAEGRAVVIDGQYDEHYPDQPELNEYELQEIEDGDLELEEEEQYEPIEGKTAFDVGWMYVDMQNVDGVYDTLSEHYDSWIRPSFYKRPPAVWNGSPF